MKQGVVTFIVAMLNLAESVLSGFLQEGIVPYVQHRFRSRKCNSADLTSRKLLGSKVISV